MGGIGRIKDADDFEEVVVMYVPVFARASVPMGEGNRIPHLQPGLPGGLGAHHEFIGAGETTAFRE